MKSLLALCLLLPSQLTLAAETLIEAALAPARKQFKPAALKHLTHALAPVIGTEAMVVCKDVLRLDDAQSRKVRRGAIRALIDAARRQTAPN